MGINKLWRDLDSLIFSAPLLLPTPPPSSTPQPDHQNGGGGGGLLGKFKEVSTSLKEGEDTQMREEGNNPTTSKVKDELLPPHKKKVQDEEGGVTLEVKKYIYKLMLALTKEVGVDGRISRQWGGCPSFLHEMEAEAMGEEEEEEEEEEGMEYEGSSLHPQKSVLLQRSKATGSLHFSSSLPRQTLDVLAGREVSKVLVVPSVSLDVEGGRWGRLEVSGGFKGGVGGGGGGVKKRNVGSGPVGVIRTTPVTYTPYDPFTTFGPAFDSSSHSFAQGLGGGLNGVSQVGGSGGMASVGRFDSVSIARPSRHATVHIEQTPVYLQKEEDLAHPPSTFDGVNWKGRNPPLGRLELPFIPAGEGGGSGSSGREVILGEEELKKALREVLKNTNLANLDYDSLHTFLSSLLTLKKEVGNTTSSSSKLQSVSSLLLEENVFLIQRMSDLLRERYLLPSTSNGAEPSSSSKHLQRLEEEERNLARQLEGNLVALARWCGGPGTFLGGFQDLERVGRVVEVGGRDVVYRGGLFGGVVLSGGAGGGGRLVPCFASNVVGGSNGIGGVGAVSGGNAASS